MNYLAVDTSGKCLNIIVYKNGEYFILNDEECGVHHSEKIMVEIEKLLEKAKMDLKSCDFIACSVGAGSFTGIRIGVATVKALCFAHNIPVLSITSFDTMAYNERDKKVLAVIDAGHNGFYAAGYEKGKVIYSPAYIMREQLIELSKEYKLLSSTDIEGIEIQKVSILEGLKKAILSKSEQKTNNLDELIPLYVRKSQAEEGR